jgi:hypothetical protein
MRILAAAAFVVLSALGRTDVRISGRIMDQTGAPIPDAAVRLKLAATTGSQRLAGEAVCPTSLTSATPGTTVLALASRDGTFSFPAESRQAYELNVESPGFATIVKTIHVGAEKEFKAGDIVLSVANSSAVEFERTVFVRGIGGTSSALSVADLVKLPQQTVKTTDHGIPVTFQGVLLADVLSKVATPTDEVQIVTGTFGVWCHPTAASYDVLVQGKDGNRAVFDWAELDPRFTDRAVYLVTERDGKPLPDKDGPFQLVAPGGKTRWVRQVFALTIRRAN